MSSFNWGNPFLKRRQFSNLENTPLLQNHHNLTSPCDQVAKMASDTRKEEEVDNEGDVISKCIGDFGRWQLTFTFILSLFNLPCTWHIYALTFQCPEVNFWCAPPPNLQQLPTDLWRNISHTPLPDKAGYNPCKIWDIDYEKYTVETIMNHNFADEGAGQRECTNWNFEEDSPEETIRSKWSLVCGRATLANAAETTFLAGVAFGGLISGFLSDRYGRKKTLMGSAVLQLILGVTLAFIPWLELFLVLKFFLGLISVSIVFTGFVLCMELVGGKWRTISGVAYIFPVALGYISSAGIAYFVREWKYNQLAISLPGLLLISLYWILPESPRWLLTMNRVDENIETLKEACAMNRIPVPPNLDKLLQQSANVDSVTETTVKSGLFDLFRYPNIRKKTLILLVIWFGVYFVYYGLVMNMTNFGGDIYINTIISGFVEIPSIGISILILLKLGRRWPMSLTLIGSGLVCSLCIAFRADTMLVLAMMARSLIACSNMILPVYTAELFPTVVRNLGVGACNMSGGAAMVIVPFLWELTAVSDKLPMILLGVCGAAGGLVALTLPETANQPMINTLEEGEELGRRVEALKNAPQPNPMVGNFNNTYPE